MPYTETHAAYKNNLYMYRAIIHDLAANGIRMPFLATE
ncbi:RAxF-45 family protein [Virgibacillus senegalensis]|nr:RAxF-45 family protein [Virgibacillus senegalensis]